MHSFHPSRGRILFEVFCVLGVAASLAGAWQQTGATALLAASAAAALFGFSHAFAMRRGPAAVAEPQRIDFSTENEAAVDLNAAEPTEAEAPEPSPQVETAEPASPADPPPKQARKAKAPRKSTARRSKTQEMAVASEPAPPVETEVVVPMDFEDDHHRIEPLFEPEPFVRQPRAVVFGRKAG